MAKMTIFAKISYLSKNAKSEDPLVISFHGVKVRMGDFRRCGPGSIPPSAIYFICYGITLLLSLFILLQEVRALKAVGSIISPRN